MLVGEQQSLGDAKVPFDNSSRITAKFRDALPHATAMYELRSFHAGTMFGPLTEAAMKLHDRTEDYFIRTSNKADHVTYGLLLGELEREQDKCEITSKLEDLSAEEMRRLKHFVDNTISVRSRGTVRAEFVPFPEDIQVATPIFSNDGGVR